MTPVRLPMKLPRAASTTLGFVLGAAGPAQLSASAEITVAGAAATVESDAPDYVEPLSDTKVTITVHDDEGVLVGATAINVVQVAGDGLTEGLLPVDAKQTHDGQASFTYAAGLSGEAVFRVIAGSGPGAVRDVITLSVGAPAEEEVVEDTPTWSVPLSEGWNLVAWLGEDDTAVGDAVGDANATAVYSWSQAAGWTFWFSDSASGVSTDTLSEVSTNPVVLRLRCRRCR